MGRKLIIDGNAVYEIDEECMIKNRIDKEKKQRENETNKEEKNKKS